MTEVATSVNYSLFGAPDTDEMSRLLGEAFASARPARSGCVHDYKQLNAHSGFALLRFGRQIQFHKDRIVRVAWLPCPIVANKPT
jgi:hypothetical protein